MKNLEKQTLLQTPMNELPLGKAFADSFISSPMVPTLSEFISENSFLKYDSDFFTDLSIRNNNFFMRKSKKWQKLKSFLLENGFTPEDWAMLIPKVKISGRMVDDFSKLKKEQLLKLPVNIVCPGKSSKYYGVETVEEFINNKDEIRHPTSAAFEIQKKLRSLGFDEQDSEFMKLKNPKTRIKDFYIQKLIKEKGYSTKEAEEAVEIGLDAGWIRVD